MIKRNGSFPLGRGIALGALLALAGAAYAQTDILSAAANSNLTSITIAGRALQPVSGPPLVSLGSHVLTVTSFTNTQISASLPPGLKPGSYDLAVTANGAANFAVTIEVAGPAGPAGPQGSPGAAGPAGPTGPQGPPGTSLSLPFSGTVAAATDAAFTVINSAGTGMVAVGAGGSGANMFGGVTGGVGQAGIGALGGGGSGATNGGPGVSATGGLGSNVSGDGLVGTGGTSSSGVGGNGVTGTGGTTSGTGVTGGDGVTAHGGQGDFAGNGISAFGAGLATGCSSCSSGTGGYFAGGGTVYDGARWGGDGVDASPGSNTGVGVFADSVWGVCAGCAGSNTVAGIFDGDVQVSGNLSKAGGSFQIDHPLDPANKYLYHSFVESPDMKNVYDGTVHTDGAGNAVVTLPEWFEALNRDFRYQLTSIGQPARAWIAAEVANNQFSIRTDRPNVKVSWQVTGIRQDAWANAHRIPVEAEKDKADQGHYLHPELFEHAGEPSIAETHHPRPKKRQQQTN